MTAPAWRIPTVVDGATLAALVVRAEHSLRARAHIVLSRPCDDVQRLVVAAVPEGAPLDAGARAPCYSRPHRFHCDQTIAVLRGDAWLLTWTSTEQAPRRLRAGDVVDLPAPAPYHAILVVAPTVLLETLRGPYTSPRAQADPRREDAPGWPEELGRGGNGADAAAAVLRYADWVGVGYPASLRRSGV